MPALGLREEKQGRWKQRKGRREKRTKNRATYQDPSSPSHYCLLHAWTWTLELQRKECFRSVLIPLTWAGTFYELDTGDRLTVDS